MRCFRIGDARFPLFDCTGACLYGGRWNSPGRAVIYAAETYAGAILEILVHANLNRLPRTHAVIAIEIPGNLAIESISPPAIPGWHNSDLSASRAFGDRWLTETRTSVLLVPSLITQGREQIVLLNPAHPDFKLVTHTPPEPFVWDERLFRN